MDPQVPGGTPKSRRRTPNSQGRFPQSPRGYPRVQRGQGGVLTAGPPQGLQRGVAMYNGIGLPTPRGSGTNGYVQRNLGALRHKRERADGRPEDELRKLEASLAKKPNRDILDHERKRKVELKCLELSELMEEQG